MRVTVMVDGSFCPNTRAAAYGYWIVSDRGRISGSGVFKAPIATPIETEMASVANGIAVGLQQRIIHPGDDILIQIDCIAAIERLNRVRFTNTEMQETIVEGFVSLIRRAQLSYKFRHVRGHSRRIGSRFHANNSCDTLARDAMRKRRAEIEYAER